MLQLCFCRKLAEKQKISDLLVSECVVCFGVLYQIFDVVSAVEKFSRNRNFLAVFYLISNNIANACKPNKNTSAVRVSKPAFYIVFCVKAFINWIIAFG